MKLPADFLKKLHQEPALTPEFVLKYHEKLSTDHNLNEIINTSEDIVKILKLKLIMIVANKSKQCELNINELLLKTGKSNLIKIHEVLLYGILIQPDLNVTNILLNSSYDYLTIHLNENNKNATLYHLELINTIMEVCILLNSHIIKSYDDQNKLFDLIILLICYEDRDIQKKILIDVVPKYIKCTNKNKLFSIIWEKILNSPFETSILIALENYYFCETYHDDNFHILNDIKFWVNLQEKITSLDPVLKKQALYLLKKSVECLFNNQNQYIPMLEIIKSENNINFNDYKIAWKTFFTLCDISNEKQLHLIEPTFKLINSLKVLHISWQNCVSKLFVNHPHSAVVKYAIRKILKLHWSCDLDTLMQGLNNVFLYEDSTIYPTKDLLRNYVDHLNQNQVETFIDKICFNQPSPIPFYFICKSIETFKFENINFKIIFDLLTSSTKVPCLFIRKGIQYSLFKIFIAMTSNVEYIDDQLKDDFIKISCEFFDKELLQDRNKRVKDQLKYLIQTKYKIDKFELDKMLLFSPRHYAVFLGFLLDQNIIEENLECMYFKELLSVIKNTKCCETKYKVILILFNIIETRNKINTCYRLSLSNDDIQNILSEVLMICKSSEFNNYYSLEFFRNIVFIFEILILYKINDSDFCISCLNILNDLKNQNKYTCFIFILEKVIVLIKGENAIYFNTLKLQLKEIKSKLEYELIEKPNENIIKRKVLSIYYCIQSNLTKLLFEISKESKNIFEKINKYYDKGGTEIIFHVINILNILITNIELNEMDISELLNLLKRLETDIFHLRSNKLFRPAISNYINLIMSIKISEQEEINTFINNFCLKIFDTKQTMSGLRNEILKKSLTVLKAEILVEGLLYGPLLRKDEKIEFDTCAFISKEFKNDEMHCHEENPYELDAKVTSIAVFILLNMCTNGIFYEEVLDLLKYKYEQCAGKRYFGDSQIHITKLRIMQTLHLLLDSLNEQYLNMLTTWLYDCLVTESQQPSIRLLIQWLLIRCYEKLNNISSTINYLITSAKQIGGTSVTSIFPLLYHLTKIKTTNIEVIYQCIEFLMPYTMGQQFNIRYIAQLTIKNIYENSEVDLAAKYSSIYKTITDVINQTVCDKISDNILTFSDLPLTIETIYYEIPRLTNVSITKLIPVEYFLNVPLMELTSDVSLKHFQTKLPTTNLTLLLDIDNENMNVQKKIDTTAINTFVEENCLTNKVGNLIVVACLIDRAPNLGGLSRTCEVFGVNQYVLNNIQFMKNKEYQSLSMSSEKWIDTIEVKIENLTQYLIEMKRQGYQVVGAEQTTDSKKLDSFQFEKNTVLLLGNEKEGISSNLIHFLDECIEIPQFGQIRSLNVHVAGALFIWEYAKQYCKFK